MAKTIDARGLSCPQPVLLSYRAIEAGQLPLEVTVDNPTARENIRRMAAGQGCKVEISENNEDYCLKITK